MICHNIIKYTKTFDEDIHSYIKDIIIQLLDKCVHKQAILFEVNKYFIYLNDDDRNSIIKKYTPEKFDENKFDYITSDNLEDFIFYMKLRKCFNLDKDKPTSDNIIYIFKAYLYISNNIINNIKLEKGERGRADDLIILANEYYYEQYGEEKNGKKLIDISLALVLMCMNIYSRKKSPYNYDISYYLAKTYSHLVMNEEALDTLIYMNLKGPQVDTISAFLFSNFINYPHGLNLLITNCERWQNDNSTNSLKTFWKMIDAGNFWKTQELLNFLDDNNLSYYNHLLQFFEIIIGLNEAIYDKDGIDELREKNHYEALEKYYEKILPIMDKFVKSQDVLFLLHKYDPNDYLFFNNNFDILNTNNNYKETNYRHIIDTLNKKNNCLYEYYPGYKNNFFEHKSISLFGEYDNTKCLFMRTISLVLISKLKIDNKKIDTAKIAELNEKYKKVSTELNSKLDINLSSIIDIILESLKNAKNLVDNKDKLVELLSYFREDIIKQLNEIKNEFFFNKMDKIIKLNEIFYKNKYFYLFLYSNATSKIYDIIQDHKKESNDIANLKTKFNEIYKTPLTECLRDLQNKLEDILKQKSTNEAKWDYDSDVKKYFKDFPLGDEVSSIFSDFSNKLRVKHSELFDQIKNQTKNVISYIKQIL